MYKKRENNKIKFHTEEAVRVTAREFLKKFRSKEVKRLMKEEKEMVKLYKTYIKKNRRRRTLRVLAYILALICEFFECVWAEIMYLAATVKTLIDKHCSKSTKEALLFILSAVLIAVGAGVLSISLNYIADILCK